MDTDCKLTNQNHDVCGLVRVWYMHCKQCLGIVRAKSTCVESHVFMTSNPFPKLGVSIIKTYRYICSVLVVNQCICNLSGLVIYDDPSNLSPLNHLLAGYAGQL